jgi:hypothetical protein
MELPNRAPTRSCARSFNSTAPDFWIFFTLADARRKLGHWRHDYNHHRPHSALGDRTPVEFAAECSGANDGDDLALENAARFPHSHRAAAADHLAENGSSTTPLLEIVT